MALKVTLAGQDISAYVDESTFDIEDTWGQGPGVGQGSAGRAATAKFVVSLGPIAKALGAGSSEIPTNPTTNLLTTQQADVEGTDVSGFLKGGSPMTLSRDAAQAWHGSSALKVVTNGGGWTFESVSTITAASQFTPGATYTFSAYMKWDGVSNGGVAPVLRFYCQANDQIAGNTSIGTVGSITLTTTWTRYVFTVTMPTDMSHGGVAFTVIGMRADTGGTSQAAVFWMDGMQIEQSATVTPWHVGAVTPVLVRMGEVIIYDAQGNKVYGGYATDMKDKTPRHQKYPNYTELDCVDYWQHLDRINVQGQVFDGQMDTEVLTSLANLYAPWLGLSLLPSPTYQFGPLNFQNKTLQQAFQQVADTTGYAIWIDDDKNLHYVNPFQTATAPFYLSDTPDFVTSFPHRIDEYETDDDSAVNRVTFYGGKNLSTDFWQDLSPQANGSNTLFTLAYYPHKTTDGKYHVQAVQGTDLVVGFDGSSGSGNTLKQDGGTADVLLNIDNHTLTFDSSHIPVAANHPRVQYRREKPLIVVVTDPNSYAYFGTYLDGTISDSTVFDNPTAIKRCRTLLAEQSMGLTTFKAIYRQPGIQAGMVVQINNQIQGVNGTFLVQEVDIKSLGAGKFEYTAHLGAWNFNVLDILKQNILASTQEDTAAYESETPAVAVQLALNPHITISLSTQTRTMSGYFLRSTPVGDGHDAKFGLFSF